MRIGTRSIVRFGCVVAVLLTTLPTAASAQIVPPPLPPPCPIPCPFPEGPVVVEDYRVEVAIEDQVAVTRVTEVLRNDGERQTEAEFLHPLPPGAVVTDLVLWIDGEPVAGEVLEAGEAREIYWDIVAAIRDPALVEFVDFGLVRASVFPIPAGGERRIELEYTQVLQSDRGLVRYRHPFGTELGGRSAPERISARIEIESSDELKTIYSPTHEVGVERDGPHSAVVGYESGDRIPEAELAVYYSTATVAIGLDVLSFREPAEGEGFFVLLASPGELAGDDRAAVAKDVIVVIDRSGSMEGDKLRQAQEAVGFVLDNLNENDRFTVIAFSTGVDAYSGRLRPADEADRAAQWVDGLGAAGSTDIGAALTAAFEAAGVERPSYVLFLTDGLPTEGEVDPEVILDDAQAAPDNVSVFAFGVGYDVDTVLLDTLAQQHHGTTTYVTPDEDVDEAVTSLYAKVASPVLTDLRLDFGEVQVFDVYPDPLPDLFAGEQLVVVGRYREGGTTDIVLGGAVEGSREHFRFEDRSFAADGGTEAVPRLWATRKIGHLLRLVRIAGPEEETIDQIVRLSIRHGIVTPYTSYLVTEPSPLGAAEAERIAEHAYQSAVATTLPASGEEAVSAAEAAGELADSDVAAAPTDEYADRVKIAGSRTLVWSGTAWVDTAFDPDTMNPLAVPFLSEAYLDLAAGDRDLAEALSVAEPVIVVWRGAAYQIVAAAAAGDDVVIPVEGTTTTVAATPTTTAPADGGAPGENLGSDDSGGLGGWIALAGGAVLAGGSLATATAVRRRRAR